MLNFPVDFFRYLIHVYKVNVDAVEKAMTGSKSKQKKHSIYQTQKQRLRRVDHPC